MKVIAIHGKKRTGKNVMLTELQKHLAWGAHFNHVEVFHFADHLKDMAALTFGIERWIFDCDTRKDYTSPIFGYTYRELVIELSEVIKKVWGEDFFVKVVREKVNKLPDQDNTLVILGDMRFPVEEGWVRKGFPTGVATVLHVRRDTLPVAGVFHRSEAGIKALPEDHVFYNNGTLDAYKEQIRLFCRRYVDGL